MNVDRSFRLRMPWARFLSFGFSLSLHKVGLGENVEPGLPTNPYSNPNFHLVHLSIHRIFLPIHLYLQPSTQSSIYLDPSIYPSKYMLSTGLAQDCACYLLIPAAPL